MQTDDPLDLVDPQFSLRLLMAPLEPYIRDERVTELCINRPGVLFVELGGGWQRVEDEALTLHWAHALVTAAAVADGRRVDANQPFLNAALPHSIRLSAVLPPACPKNRILLSLRVAPREQPGHTSFQWTHRKPAVTKTLTTRTGKAPVTSDALRDSIRSRQNILVIGDTGSGKTAMLSYLLSHVDPHERLVTLEDVAEIALSSDRNHAPLFYGDGIGISASTCLREALRLRPDRIVLSECRGAESFDFLQILMSGHRGAITTLHADCSEHAIARLVVMACTHPAAALLNPSVLEEIAARHLDLVIHVARDSRMRSAEVTCLR
jgi:type IV secretion system protein VirB11